MPRDALPYTVEFDRLKSKFDRRFRRASRHAHFWRILEKVGKRGGLARAGSRKKTVPAPRLTTEQQLEVLRLFPDGIGNRDQLPYTQEFDHLRSRFSQLTGTTLKKRDFWRALSRVGKRSRKPQPLFDTAPLGGLPADLVQLLELQNPWWSGKPLKPIPLFRRWACDEVMRRLQSTLTPIVAVRGPRQVGKTTVQEQLIEEMLRLKQIEPARIFRVQFDEVPSLGSFNQPVLALVRWYEKNILRGSLNASARSGEPAYLFFDEVQNLKAWDPQLKTLVDHASAKTLVTGSSALRIAGGQDSLAGRASVVQMGPLRLHEIAGMRQLGTLPPFRRDAQIEVWTDRAFWLDLLRHARQYQRVLKKSFDAFSELGGYPICHNGAEQRLNLSRRIVDTVIDRTFLHDLKAGPQGRRRDRGVLEETFKLICRYAGQPVSPRRIREEIAQVLGAGVRQKLVSDAIRFLASALLVHEIPPLEVLTKKQSHPCKLCLCDHFVREAWLQERIPIAPRELARANQAVSTIAGHIVESIIGCYLEGIQGLEVSWFPPRHGEPEIDFVLTIGMQRIPIEVKYRRGAVKPSDIEGIRSFCSQQKYNAPFGLLVTQEFAGVMDNTIIAIPAYVLLTVQ